jgi:sulfofructose kinase
MSGTWDILGIGALAVDELHRVARFPKEDSKVRVSSHERRFGGLTGTALIAAARMGASCACAGILGDDEDSRFVRDTLASEHIDITGIIHDPAARPFHGTIIISEESGTRTVLSQLASTGRSSVRELPRARILLVDHHLPWSVFPSLLSQRHLGSQVVADLERVNDHSVAIEEFVDHLIVPLAYARERIGLEEPRAVTHALWSRHRRMVAVTDGEHGSWYTDDGIIHHQPIYVVEAVETNGCGDVFHGGYAWSLQQGDELSRRMRTASAAAAVKAGSRGLSTFGGLPAIHSLMHPNAAAPTPSTAS